MKTYKFNWVVYKNSVYIWPSSVTHAELVSQKFGISPEEFDSLFRGRAELDRYDGNLRIFAFVTGEDFDINYRRHKGLVEDEFEYLLFPKEITWDFVWMAMDSETEFDEKSPQKRGRKVTFSAGPRQVNISQKTVSCPLWGGQVSLALCEACEFHEGYDDDGLVVCMFDGEGAGIKISRQIYPKVLYSKKSNISSSLSKVCEMKVGKDVMKNIFYHVTTQKDKALGEGLKARNELGEEQGYGLGGGSGEYISLTSSLETARDIYDNLIWANRYYSGRVSWRQLLEMARRGEMASEPYNENLEKNFTGKEKELENPLSRTGRDFFNQWLMEREMAGGPENAVIIFSNLEKFSKIPEDQIAILEVEISPGYVPASLMGAESLFDDLEYYYGITKEDFFKNDLLHYPGRVVPLMKRKYYKKYMRPGEDEKRIMEEAEYKAQDAMRKVNEIRNYLLNYPLEEVKVRPQDIKVRRVVSSNSKLLYAKQESYGDGCPASCMFGDEGAGIRMARRIYSKGSADEIDVHEYLKDRDFVNLFDKDWILISRHKSAEGLEDVYCQNCGRKLSRYVYTIRNIRTGEEKNVGSECCKKLTGRTAQQLVSETLRNLRTYQRMRKEEEELNARRDIYHKFRQLHREEYEFLRRNKDFNEFMRSLWEYLERKGVLTDRQLELLRQEMGKNWVQPDPELKKWFLSFYWSDEWQDLRRRPKKYNILSDYIWEIYERLMNNAPIDEKMLQTLQWIARDYKVDLPLGEVGQEIEVEGKIVDIKIKSVAPPYRGETLIILSLEDEDGDIYNLPLSARGKEYKKLINSYIEDIKTREGLLNSPDRNELLSFLRGRSLKAKGKIKYHVGGRYDLNYVKLAYEGL